MPKKKLTRDAVLAAAIKLADKEGLNHLSMRKLARKFHVEAMSLYHHVKNRDDILDGITDLIFAEIDWPIDEPDWKSAMRLKAISTREVLNKHPWAISLLDSRENPGPRTLEVHNNVIGTLRKAGFSIDLCAHAYSVMDSYIYGFVLQEQALPFQNEKELRKVADQILQGFAKETYPHLFELTSEYVLKPGYSYKEEFLYGLDLLLDAIEGRLKK